MQMMQRQRLIAAATCVVAVLVASVVPVTAQPPAPPPSFAFSSPSLHALRSAPDRSSSARWNAVLAARPEAVLRAIARAEARGWKATNRTLRAVKGVERSTAAVRTVALTQDFYGSSGDGEMLVWEWDDGNPNTAEGTVWIRSYHTGNEAMFNVQFAGWTYAEAGISYGEDVYAAYNEPAPEGVVPGGIAVAPLAAAPRLRTIGWGGQRSADDCSRNQACYLQKQNGREMYCRDEWARAGLSCYGRAARHALREGMIGAAFEAGIGAVGGAFAGGLAGAIGGGAAGAAHGFLGNVIETSVRSADGECRGDARLIYDRCMREPMDYSSCDTRYPCGPVAQPAVLQSLRFGPSSPQ